MCPVFYQTSSCLKELCENTEMWKHRYAPRHRSLDAALRTPASVAACWSDCGTALPPAANTQTYHRSEIKNECPTYMQEELCTADSYSHVKTHMWLQYITVYALWS